MLLAAANTDLVPLLILPVAVGVGVLSLWWHFHRSKILLLRWATRNGLRVVSCEHRWLRRGPFWWRTSKAQSVYRVEVINPDGVHYWGFVRVGGWFLGLWSDTADAIWDDATSPDQRGFPVLVPGERQHENRIHG